MIPETKYFNDIIHATRTGIKTGEILGRSQLRRELMETPEINWNTICQDAHKLLEDPNLVWSDDFELIRKDLSWYIYMNPGDTAARLIAGKIVLTHG